MDRLECSPIKAWDLETSGRSKLRSSGVRVGLLHRRNDRNIRDRVRERGSQTYRLLHGRYERVTGLGSHRVREVHLSICGVKF